MTAGAAELVLGGGLFNTFAEFVEELRAAGVPVSTTEVLDATEALRHLPLEDREALKQGLAASLVKEEGHWRTFEMLFELFFSLQGRLPGDLASLAGGEPAAGDGEGMSARELAQLAYEALMEGDPELMAALARGAVDRFAGMEPGRPVGGSYYVFKTLRQLEADGDVGAPAQRSPRGWRAGGDDPGPGLPGSLRAPARRGRGGGPPEVGGRPGGQGRRESSAAPVARGHRFHAPRQGRTSRPATHRTAVGTQAGSAPRPQTPPPRRRAPRFPSHDATLSVLWWRPR